MNFIQGKPLLCAVFNSFLGVVYPDEGRPPVLEMVLLIQVTLPSLAIFTSQWPGIMFTVARAHTRHLVNPLLLVPMLPCLYWASETFHWFVFVLFYSRMGYHEMLGKTSPSEKEEREFSRHSHPQ